MFNIKLNKKYLNQTAGIAIAIYSGLVFIADTISSDAGGEYNLTTLEKFDNYNFYQAKRIRQVIYEVSHNQISLLPTSPAQQALITKYRQNIEEHEAGKDSKSEIMKNIRAEEDKLAMLANKMNWLGFATQFLEMAILIASIGVVINAWGFILFSGIFFVLGFSSLMNALYLFI